jgi:hypothetical protein
MNQQRAAESVRLLRTRSRFSCRPQARKKDSRGVLFGTILMCVIFPVATGVWAIRRQVLDVLPRKRRLEALLKELDAR